MNSESQADRSMDGNSPHQVLGIARDASFEEIKAARDHLIQQLSQDEEQQLLVEQAYDSILMERLRLRQEGKISVPEDIRNPDRAETPNPKNSRWSIPSMKSARSQSTPNWASRLIDSNPEPRDIWLPFAIMVGIYVLTLFFNPAGHGLPLAAGMMAAIYFIYRKERLFWRAALYGLVGLIVGLLLAQIPLALGGGAEVLNNRPEAFDTNTTEGIVLALLWLCAAFLR